MCCWYIVCNFDGVNQVFVNTMVLESPPLVIAGGVMLSVIPKPTVPLICLTKAHRNCNQLCTSLDTSNKGNQSSNSQSSNRPTMSSSSTIRQPLALLADKGHYTSWVALSDLKDNLLRILHDQILNQLPWCRLP
jgi:hypothetical protein